MTRVAILSDTHVPSRADEIPDWVEVEIEDADHVIHAGDFDSKEAYGFIEAFVEGEFTAVHGNTDPASLDLPTVVTAWIEGRPFVVTHGAGPSRSYRDRVHDAVRDETDHPAAIGVAGHTHEVMDEEYEGIRLLNPGSATGALPATDATMLVADVDEESVDVEALREG